MANNTGSNYTSTTYLDPYKLAKEQYDSIDEQAILDRYNQATAAQFAAQQNQNMIAENNFYNQMYNTQRTAMDTIRQSNANAVSTGASRGMQAANELSALLGLQQESIASATELANARRQTAQEETAAMLQNIVQASQDAANQRQQALNAVIQAQSLRAQEDANDLAAQDQYLTVLKEQGKLNTEGAAILYKNRGYQDNYSAEAETNFNTDLGNVLNAEGVSKLPTAETMEHDWANGLGGTVVVREANSTKNAVAQYATTAMGLTDKDVQEWCKAVSLVDENKRPLYNTVSAYVNAQYDNLTKGYMNSRGDGYIDKNTEATLFKNGAENVNKGLIDIWRYKNQKTTYTPSAYTASWDYTKTP